MNATERRMEIHRLLKEQASVEVNDLAERFGVSGMTIRRDLAAFEKQGLVTTAYGGAYLNREVAGEPSFSVKSGQRIHAKQCIAREAARHIREGESILVDCGTTTLQLARFIQDMKLTVITNSWALVGWLGSSSRTKLILLPGEYDEVSAGVFGESTINFLRGIHADSVFIGTHGWDLQSGATVPTLADAEVKKALLRAAKRAFLLADSGKFGETHLAQHADLTDFEGIITDRELGRDARVKLENNGVRWRIADEGD